jgi:hypothetical protein
MSKKATVPQDDKAGADETEEGAARAFKKVVPKRKPSTT